MKVLLVLRHANANQDSPSNKDFDRPLSSRGRRQAVALGRMMSEQGMTIDAIVASPATRVVETVSGVSEGAGISAEPVFDRRLYNASPDALLAVIREVDDKMERLLIVGHNPGLQYLLLHLASNDSDGSREEVASGFPTAMLAEVHLSIESWSAVGLDTSRIVSLVRPED